jgi:phospholipid-binding lipoprotein MlaA
MMPISKVQLSLLLTSLALGGCASTSHNPQDPFESFNRGVYQFNDTLDKAVIKPVAQGYNTVVPEPGRMMLSSFFSNLNDVVVLANDLLQFKVVQAVSDTGRIVVNTTFGVFGVADVATAIGLKKHNADFGQTLGHWGIGSGPYLMLPLFGPSSVRDGVGLYADSFASPIMKISNVDTRNEAYVTNLIGKRAALLDQENVLDEAAIDRYAFIRDAYLQHRQSLVYDGNPPREKYDDEEDGSKPDKGSLNDKEENAQPATAAVTPVVTPIATATLPLELPVTDISVEPSAPKQTPAVWRMWVSQREGIR